MLLKRFFSFILYSPELLLCVILISFLIKIYLIKLLIPSGVKKFTIKHSWVFLLATLIGAFFGDLIWIIKLMRDMNILIISYPSFMFLIRISWAFLILQYQALALLLESSITKKLILQKRQKYCIIVSSLIASYFVYLSLFEPNLTNKITRSGALHLPLWSTTIKKSKKNNISQETHFNPIYHITDPELAEVVQLGKHALRASRIMGLLWHNFRNQNKIANFLGVNRSSVNRHFKQYQLH